jgi:hypothetical protein
MVSVKMHFRVMLFNATFNNVSVISWQSVLLVEETRVPGENHWGEVYSIQHYVIKFFSDLRQASGFLRVLWFPPPIKLTATCLSHDIWSHLNTML